MIAADHLFESDALPTGLMERWNGERFMGVLHGVAVPPLEEMPTQVLVSGEDLSLSKWTINGIQPPPRIDPDYYQEFTEAVRAGETAVLREGQAELLLEMTQGRLLARGLRHARPDLANHQLRLRQALQPGGVPVRCANRAAGEVIHWGMQQADLDMVLEQWRDHEPRLVQDVGGVALHAAAVTERLRLSLTVTCRYPHPSETAKPPDDSQGKKSRVLDPRVLRRFVPGLGSI